MKKILLPTDFSGNSWNAISYAVQLYKRESCVFYLLNTYASEIQNTAYVTYSGNLPGLDEIYHNSSEQNLIKLHNRIVGSFPNPRHHFELISSMNSLNEEIKEQVREKEIDLVVMGTKGAAGAREILFGSNTVRAIKRMACPLLAVPSNFNFRKPVKILFPTNFEESTGAVQLDPVRELCDAFNSRLEILNIHYGIPLGPDQQKQKQYVQNFFKNRNLAFQSVSGKSVPEAIYQFVEEKPVDLLVMINKKHSFLENILFHPVIYEIGYHIKLPFLVIPSSQFTVKPESSEKREDFNTQFSIDSII